MACNKTTTDYKSFFNYFKTDVQYFGDVSPDDPVQPVADVTLPPCHFNDRGDALYPVPCMDFGTVDGRQIHPMPVGYGAAVAKTVDKLQKYADKQQWWNMWALYTESRNEFRTLIYKSKIHKKVHDPFTEIYQSVIRLRQNIRDSVRRQGDNNYEILQKMTQIEKYIDKKRTELWNMTYVKDDDADLKRAFEKCAVCYHFISKHNVNESNHKKPRQPPAECSICLGECLQAELPCGHKFGESCIKRWVMEGNRKCPVCRAPCRTTDISPV